MRPRSVETRMLDAVLAVLALAGCQRAPASEPLRPQSPRATGEPDPWATPVAPDAGVVVAPDASTVVATPPPPPPSPEETEKARQICERYKKDQKPLKTPPKPTGQPSSPVHVTEVARWDRGKQHAVCTIIRDQVATWFSVTYEPGETRCCPPADCSNHTAPKPSKVKVDGTYTLVEAASVGADGTRITSTTYWTPFWHQMQPIPLSQQPYCGRRPEGLAFTGDATCTSPIGAMLAASAELEAASVPAFERLARELEVHGAPSGLVRRARMAMRDEIRHARTMKRLAARFGAKPRATTVAPQPIRPLAAIALENVIEGCVHEAFGALVASYQAERAQPELRAAFAAIAADERTHVTLAEDVHAWLTSVLDPASSDELHRARDRAIESLRERLAGHTASPELGVPGPDVARALCDAYFGAPLRVATTAA